MSLLSKDRTGRWERPLLAMVALALACIGFMSAAGSARAASTVCTQPDGFQFRADWTRSNGILDVTNLRMRANSGAAWSNYTDTWGRVAKMEWWTGETLEGLLTHDDGPWNSVWTTGSWDQAHYDAAYGHVDQRADILATGIYPFLSARISTRTNGSPFVHDADQCNVFLSDWSTASGPRVAITGDSLTVQMTKRYLTSSGWRSFVEPRSGAKFATHLGEIRGLAAGIRDPNTGAQTPPDALVMAFGTNDSEDISNQPDEAARDAALTGFNWIFARALMDTADVQCRVLLTVHESGWRKNGNGQTYYDAEFKEARQEVNAVFRAAAANDPSIELVEWAGMSAKHGWFEPAEEAWFPSGDPSHPNGAGLTAMSNAVKAAAIDCGG